VPEAAHDPAAPPPPMVPARPAVPALEQSAWFGPASTVAGTLTFIFTVSLTAAQGPLPVEVKVKITLPAAISAGVNE